MRGRLALGIWLVGLGLLLAGGVPRATLAQTSDCVQPAPLGCPLPLDHPVQGILQDPAQVDTWVVHLDTGGDLKVTLSGLPADYDVHLFRADGTLVGESQNEGNADDVVLVPNAPPGDYYAYVNSARGGVSPQPYRLQGELIAAASTVPTPGAPRIGRIYFTQVPDPSRRAETDGDRFKAASGPIYAFYDYFDVPPPNTLAGYWLLNGSLDGFDVPQTIRRAVPPTPNGVGRWSLQNYAPGLRGSTLTLVVEWNGQVVARRDLIFQ